MDDEERFKELKENEINVLINQEEVQIQLNVF